jgi:tetratricopeptide (TPR) repeat protein
LLISWRLLRQADIAFLYPVIIGLAGGLIAFMITACFSFPMQRSMPPLLIFTYCGILVILNYYPRLQSKNWIIRAPRFLGLGAAFCVLFTGFFLLHFNLNNIICERYYSEAMAMEKMGLDRNALSASLIANQYNTHRMDVLITMGRAYIATGELDRAIETLEKVISRYPYNLNALFFLGVAYANSDHQEKALETFRSVLQIKPDFIEVQKIICSLKAFGKARVSLS